MQILTCGDTDRLHVETTRIKTHHGQQAYTQRQTYLHIGTRVSLDTHTYTKHEDMNTLDTEVYTITHK